ncbi:MAG: hypothetical protein QOF30_3642 [Acidimicrobiaceae bacterium]|jgi:hypothetical protein|nr:hypothetical protein [Acidimicrobiaceae bacterium]
MQGATPLCPTRRRRGFVKTSAAKLRRLKHLAGAAAQTAREIERKRHVPCAK